MIPSIHYRRPRQRRRPGAEDSNLCGVRCRTEDIPGERSRVVAAQTVKET